MMKFTTVIKPARAIAALHFPNDNCVGISYVHKDKAKDRFQMKFWFSDAVSKKAGLHMQGKIIFSLSDCSNGLQISFNPKPDAEYKGFKLVPAGTARNKDEVLALGKLSVPSAVTAPLGNDTLDFRRSNIFDRTFVKILDIEKNRMVIDISCLPLYLDNQPSQNKAKPSALKKNTL